MTIEQPATQLIADLRSYCMCIAQQDTTSVMAMTGGQVASGMPYCVQLVSQGVRLEVPDGIIAIAPAFVPARPDEARAMRKERPFHVPYGTAYTAFLVECLHSQPGHAGLMALLLVASQPCLLRYTPGIIRPLPHESIFLGFLAAILLQRLRPDQGEHLVPIGAFTTSTRPDLGVCRNIASQPIFNLDRILGLKAHKSHLDKTPEQVISIVLHRCETPIPEQFWERGQYG